MVAPEAEEREACRAKAEGPRLWRDLGRELRRPRPASEEALIRALRTGLRVGAVRVLGAPPGRCSLHTVGRCS